MRELNGDQIIALESMLDLHGMYNILDALSQICEDKSAHIAETWEQPWSGTDKSLSKAWHQQSMMIDEFTAKLCKKLSSEVTG